jgi:signal transduction histidine kinase
MKRIGLLVVVLAALMLLGVGLLVARTLESIDREERMRHEVVVRRIFDEAERELTDLIDREEQRSFLEYRYLYMPEGQLPGNLGLSLSPLAAAPDEDFILGYFQVDPDGQLQLPWNPRPREQEFLTANEAWTPPQAWYRSDDEERIAALTETLRAPIEQAWQGRPPDPEEQADAAILDGASADEPARETTRRRQDKAEPKQRVETPRPSVDSTTSGLAAGGERLDASGDLAREIEPSPEPTPEPTPPPELEARQAEERQQAAREDERRREEAPAPSQAPRIEVVEAEEIAVSKTAKPKRGGGRRSQKKQPASEMDYLESLNKGSSSRAGRQSRSAPVAQGNTDVFQSDSNVYGADFDQAMDDEDLELALAEDDGEDEETEEAVIDLASADEGAVQAEARADDEPITDEELLASEVGTVQGEVAFEPLPEPDAYEEDRLNRQISDADGREAVAASTGGDDGWSADGSAPASAASEPADAPATDLPAKEDAATEPRDAAVTLGATVETSGVEVGEKDAATSTAGGATRAEPKAEEQAPPPAAPTPRPRSRRTVQTPPAPEPEPEAQVDLTPANVEVIVEPLVGLRVDPDHLVLHRTVRVGSDSYLQGLIVELPGLTEQLRERVVAGSELEPFVTLQWEGLTPEDDGWSEPAEGFAFDHAFGAPFDSLMATASLTPLPTEGGDDPRSMVLMLSILLGLVALAGFGALYRMVAVVVHFAERRNNFVAAVSHELKTPLTAIRMYGEILREGMVPGEERKQEYYETITTESERLSRLINNVLELSRLEKGTRSVALQAGNVGPLVEEVARLLSAHARDKGLELVTEIEPELPAVKFDRDALLQVLINLTDNAIKFARTSDDKTIVLQCTRQGEGVVLRVRDHGPGVPAAQLRRIFQPFYRGERELTRSTKGTGIGLALVKGLVDQMGGRVSVRNHPAGGFEVSVALA